MKQETFNRLWDRQIVPKIHQIRQSSYFLLFRNKRSFAQIKDDIFEDYEGNRYEFKKMMKGTGSILIDRHKIAALLVRSVLVVSPFDLRARTLQNKSKNPKLRDWLANEILALHCGLCVMQTFVLEDGIQKNKIENRAISVSKIIDTPDVRGGQESYEIQTCRTLRCEKRRSNFSVLLFANIMFLLEPYLISEISSKKLGL